MTKLPTGPSEGELTPADKVAPETAQYEGVAQEVGADPDPQAIDDGGEDGPTRER